MTLSEAKRIQVLIFETDDAFRRSVSERLLLGGIEVFEAADEAEAIDLTLNGIIDVVLLGGKRLGQSGLEFLKFIKKNRPLIEVILMTPVNEHSLFISMEAMKLGAFDDLLAPFDMETLHNRIREAGRRKRVNEEVCVIPPTKGACAHLAGRPKFKHGKEKRTKEVN